VPLRHRAQQLWQLQRRPRLRLVRQQDRSIFSRLYGGCMAVLKMPSSLSPGVITLRCRGAAPRAHASASNEHPGSRYTQDMDFSTYVMNIVLQNIHSS
jgi:hypothetical protein